MKEMESLERIETIISENRRHLPNVYAQYTASHIPFYEDYDKVHAGIEELNEHREAEENLGMPLKVYLKCQKGTMVYIRYKNKIIEARISGIDFGFFKTEIVELPSNNIKDRPRLCALKLLFNKYGKTWALSKGEFK